VVHDAEDGLILITLADVLNPIVQAKRDMNIEGIIQSRHDLVEDKPQLRTPGDITRKVSADLTPCSLLDVDNTVDVWNRLAPAVFLLRALGNPAVVHIWQAALDDCEIGVDPIEYLLVAGPQIQRDPPGYHFVRPAWALVLPPLQILKMLHCVGVTCDRENAEYSQSK